MLYTNFLLLMTFQILSPFTTEGSSYQSSFNDRDQSKTHPAHIGQFLKYVSEKNTRLACKRILPKPGGDFNFDAFNYELMEGSSFKYCLKQEPISKLPGNISPPNNISPSEYTSFHHPQVTKENNPQQQENRWNLFYKDELKHESQASNSVLYQKRQKDEAQQERNDSLLHKELRIKDENDDPNLSSLARVISQHPSSDYDPRQDLLCFQNISHSTNPPEITLHICKINVPSESIPQGTPPQPESNPSSLNSRVSRMMPGRKLLDFKTPPPPLPVDQPVIESDLSQTFHRTLDIINTTDEFVVDVVGVLNKSEEIASPYTRRGEEGVVYIHGLFEISRGDCREFPDTGRFEYEAAQFAIRQINERNVLDGYQLKMYYNDTLCDSGTAVDAFFHSLYRQPQMTVLLGTGSSEVTERLARVVSRWNILQMSYGATSPVLSDRKNFPMFFRTVAPDSSHNAALIAFILHYKWYTVATLHEQGDKHSMPMTKLIRNLEQNNVTVAVTKGTSERDYKDHLREIKVYNLGMYGADYAWINLGDTSETLKENSSLSECKDHQLTSAIDGVISVGSHYKVLGNGTTVSETTMSEIVDEIGFDQPSHFNSYIAQSYDAVWAVALALKEAQEHWKSTNSEVTLGDFTYSNDEMARRFVNTMAKLRFMGVSGPVSFRNSDRVGITAFHQIQGDDLKLVAVYMPDGQLNFECSSCYEIIWQGDSPPIAKRNIIMRIAVLDRRVFICVTALAVLGVILALIFLSFNLYYQKLKFIKLSSPNLNNFVIIGCILVYIAVILLGMDHGTLFSDNHFPVVCSARAFLLSGGFSLAFGCMFIKTYRVYHIFIRANTGIVKSKLLHDQQLLAMVSLLLLLDCILVILWVTIDPMERKLTNLSMQVNKDERNVVYLNLREHCSSTHMAKWLGSLYIYKGLLLVVGCYMAWETRHVKVPALNDSQYIGMSVYNVVITSIIVVALANVIPAERYTLTFVLVTTLILVSTTTTLCILFVPKIHTIFMNPEDAVVVATPGVKVECKTRRFAVDEPRESLYRAEVLNRALKKELQDLDEDFNKVAKELGITPCVVRKAEVEQNAQEEESDDELPPWIDEYKDYSGTERSNVWSTSRPTIASAFSAIHNVALQLPSTSTACQNETIVKVHVQPEPRDRNICSSLRASLSTIDKRDEIPLIPTKAVRSFLSDRALNVLKIPRKEKYNAKIPIQSCPLYTLKKNQHSEPRLASRSHETICVLQCPSRSMVQMSQLDGSQSDFSHRTTSWPSNWTTATVNGSTSFSTPPEDFASSSNNGNSKNTKTSENNPSSVYISCEESTSGSTQDSSKMVGCHSSECPENSTFCELPTSTSYTSAVSGSENSEYGATVSELSTDSSEEKKVGITKNVSNIPARTLYIAIPINKSSDNFGATCQPTQENLDCDKDKTDPSSRILPGNSREVTFHTEDISEQVEISPSQACSKASPLAECSANISQNSVNGNVSNETLTSENNNLDHQPAAERIDNLRNQIFRLERELILLQLDQSDSVDL